MQRTGSDSGFHFLQEWQQCETKFRYHVIEKLEPKYIAPPLAFGSSIHEALAEYYRAFYEPLDVKCGKAIAMFEKTMAEFQSSYENPNWYAADYERGKVLLENYAVHYSQLDQNYIKEILGIEEDLSFEYQDTHDVFTGRVDLRIRALDGRVFIYDHKTTGWTLGPLSRTLRVSHQSTGYIWLWNMGNPTDPVDGVIYNILRQNKSVTEFDRLLVTRTREEIARFSKQAQGLLDDIARKANDPDAFYYQNTANCHAYNRPCPFYDLCWTGDTQGVRDILFKQVPGAVGALPDE